MKMKEARLKNGISDGVPRAWVGCLGCYNDGRLTGKWLTAEESGDLVEAGLGRYAADINLDGTLAENPRVVCVQCEAEEFEVFDTDNAPRALGSSIAAFIECAGALEAADETGDMDAFLAYVENGGHGSLSYDEMYDQFRDAYLGEWESVVAYAEQMVEDTGMLEAMPEQLRYYFDHEAFARDMELGGDIWTLETGDGTVWVFQ